MEHYWKEAMCNVYWSLGKPEVAEQYFLRLINITGDKDFVMFLHCELARMWRQFGDVDKACAYYSKLGYFRVL